MWRIASLILIATSAAWADVPPPAGNLIPVSGMIEVTEPFADYRFFRVSVKAAPPGRKGKAQEPGKPEVVITEITLTPDKPIKVTGAFLSPVSVYAVPTAAITPGQPLTEVVAAVDQKQLAGASRQSIGSTEVVPASDTRSEVVVRYRVERAENGGGLVFRQLDESGSPIESPKVEDDSWMLWVAVGGVAALVIIVLGIWLMRKPARSPVLPASPDAGPSSGDAPPAAVS
jgi:hypothetical protein